MRRLTRIRPSPALVVASIALAVALGGTGYAALKLPANSVGSPQIKAGAVATSDLASNAVTSSKVKNGTLLKGDFKTGQIPAGRPGPPGPQGLQGAQGPAGPAGVAPPGYVAGVSSITGSAGQSTTSSSFTVLPNSTLNVTVPTGETAVLYLSFTAESQCAGVGWCSVRLTVDGNEAAPAVGTEFAFDGGFGDSYESHAMNRVSATLTAGTHTVQVQWAVVSGSTSFWLDDWALVAYRVRAS